MPRYTPERIYAAARVLLPELDEPRKGEVERLLQQAAEGQDTSLRLLDLLTQDKSLRERLRVLLKGAPGELTLGDFPPIPGRPTSTPGQVYVCPQCDYTYVIGQAGEEPGECPIHHVRLVPQAEKGG